MGNQVKYLKILKFSFNKKLIKIGILLLFPCLLYLYLFLDKNLNIKLFEKNLNQNGFLTSLKNDASVVFFSRFFIFKFSFKNKQKNKIIDTPNNIEILTKFLFLKKLDILLDFPYYTIISHIIPNTFFIIFVEKLSCFYRNIHTKLIIKGEFLCRLISV